MSSWDTAGQERFKCMAQSYYRGAHGKFLMTSYLKHELFCKTWLDLMWAKLHLYTISIIETYLRWSLTPLVHRQFSCMSVYQHVCLFVCCTHCRWIVTIILFCLISTVIILVFDLTSIKTLNNTKWAGPLHYWLIIIITGILINNNNYYYSYYYYH